MRRRSRAGEPAKTRRHKAATLKRINAPKVRGRGSPACDQETEIARVTRQRDQALEQLSEALEQDRCRGCVACHQYIARRIGAGLQRDAGKCGASLRSKFRHIESS